MNCQHCGAETSNGLALCELARRKAATDLEWLPVYFRNLARWRPGKAGSRPVPGSREPTILVTGTDRVSAALDLVGNEITTWVRALVDARPELLELRPLEAVFADLSGVDLTEAETMDLLCAGLRRWLTTISTLEWCGEFVADLAGHEEQLRGLTEKVAPGWYAGECRRCTTSTYVVPGFTWVTCGGCGATTYARDHLATVLDEARGWVARPRAIAEAIVAMVDTEESIVRLYERIKKWEQRGKLDGLRRIDRDGDPVGPKRYRLGDVLDLIARDRRGTMASERIGA